MAKVPQVSLSSGDLHILNFVFDPEAQTPSIRVDPNLPSDPQITSPEALSLLKQQEIRAIKLIESCSPNADQSEKHATYLEALGILSDLIKEYPNYASAYNNRAQLRRWRYGDHIPWKPKSSPSDAAAGNANVVAIAQALSDLTTAISLGTPARGAAVSPAQGRLLANAWTQRAAIFYTLSKDLASSRLEHMPLALTSSLPADAGELEWMGRDRMSLEEEGSTCFLMAGAYGSEVGKVMAVVSNPYARLCGAIVKEAIRGETTGVNAKG